MLHGEWQNDQEGTKFIDIQVALSPNGEVKLRSNECKHEHSEGHEEIYTTPEAAGQEFTQFLTTAYSGGPQAA